VYTLAFDHSGNLYIGGSFTNHGDANGDYITMWNGTAFSSLGTGMNDGVYGLAVAPDGAIYAGGLFTTAGGATVNCIAKWSGSAWSALGSGVAGGDPVSVVYPVKADDAGNIYIGGNFATAGGVTVNNVAVWNGSAWTDLGGGTSVLFMLEDPTVSELAISGNMLYASGGFTHAGGIAVSRIAVWNGSTWAHLDAVPPETPVITVILADGDNLYLGYSTAGWGITSKINTVVNSGTASTYPKFVFKRVGGTSAVVEWIKNEYTGDTLWLNYALLDGETLTIDLTPGKKAVTSSFFGPVWRAVLRNSDVGTFKLLPGSNNVSVFVKPVGSPTVTAYEVHKIIHHGVDGVAA
jgi:hypothetical protein